MSGVLREYDPQKITAVWTVPGPNGATVDILEGAVADSFLEIVEDNPRWNPETDRSGDEVRNKDNRRGGYVRSTIGAKSPLNKTLNALAIADDAGETIVGVILVKDLNGDGIITCLGAYLTTSPKPTFGATAAPRRWEWRTTRIDPVIDGHRIVGGTGS